jgi:hypothetical protein
MKGWIVVDVINTDKDKIPTHIQVSKIVTLHHQDSDCYLIQFSNFCIRTVQTPDQVLARIKESQ